MTHHDQRIIAYMQRFPEVKTSYVARIFAVAPQRVSNLRAMSGTLSARRTAARVRNVKAADLDRAILKAVYGRGLVDAVLNGA